MTMRQAISIDLMTFAPIAIAHFFAHVTHRLKVTQCSKNAPHDHDNERHDPLFFAFLTNVDYYLSVWQV